MIAFGIVLLMAGAALLAIEAHASTAGIIGGAGVAALIGGVALAVVGAGGGLALALPVTAVTALALLGSFVLVARRAASARRALPRGGAAGLAGHLGVVRSWSGDSGKVFVDGALWRARERVRDEHGDLHSGDPVVVDGVNGLTLGIRRAEEWEVSA